MIHSCCTSQSVRYISSIFADLQVVGIGFSSSANMPFVDITVTGLANLPLTPLALAGQISSAYGVARQNYFMNTPNGGNIVFAQAWMDAFNNSSTNIGRYCLDITPLGSLNGNSPAAFQLLDQSNPNCR